MLKKLRRRFIAVAMIAFTTVILVLFFIINISTYWSITRQQDETLQMIMTMEKDKVTAFSPGSFAPPKRPRDFSPEFPYMLRFFAVYTNEEGEIVRFNKDYIASVTKDDAKNYATQVLDRNRTEGYYQHYRYLRGNTSNGNVILFLNSEREIQMMKSVLLSTAGIAFCCLASLFVLITLFSKRAILPYVRNIETQKRFITDAGHELKTPLTAIMTSADVLSLEHENNEWIQNIQQQSNRMSKLVAELITLSRLDEERPFPDVSRFALTDAVWEISEPFAALAKADGKEYLQAIEENLECNGDKNAIQQMISILLENALKYSSESGKISLKVYKKRKRIEIVIKNSCDANQLPDLDRVFDRFYKADQSRNDHNSYGIGLSIAQSIAQNHGGSITAGIDEKTYISFTVKL